MKTDENKKYIKKREEERSLRQLSAIALYILCKRVRALARCEHTCALCAKLLTRNNLFIQTRWYRFAAAHQQPPVCHCHCHRQPALQSDKPHYAIQRRRRRCRRRRRGEHEWLSYESASLFRMSAACVRHATRKIKYIVIALAMKFCAARHLNYARERELGSGFVKFMYMDEI